MTVEDYENAGGFQRELRLVKEIGERLTTLKETVPARPHRTPERVALHELDVSLSKLRLEILQTRHG